MALDPLHNQGPQSLPLSCENEVNGALTPPLEGGALVTVAKATALNNRKLVARKKAKEEELGGKKRVQTTREVTGVGMAKSRISLVPWRLPPYPQALTHQRR